MISVTMYGVFGAEMFVFWWCVYLEAAVWRGYTIASRGAGAAAFVFCKDAPTYRVTR